MKESTDARFEAAPPRGCLAGWKPLGGRATTPAASVDAELEAVEERWTELRAPAQDRNRDLRTKLGRAKNTRAAS